MNDPLNIRNEMRAFDRKQRDWFDQLEPEQQKKFSPYLMIRWGSSVHGSSDMQEYYVLSTNYKLNRRFFSVSASRHKKLLWLLATTVSPDLGAQDHPWIKPRPREKTSRTVQMLREMYPDLNEDEINLLDRINDAADIRRAHKDHGNQD
jgi:hypothetical protein